MLDKSVEICYKVHCEIRKQLKLRFFFTFKLDEMFNEQLIRTCSNCKSFTETVESLSQGNLLWIIVDNGRKTH